MWNRRLPYLAVLAAILASCIATDRAADARRIATDFLSAASAGEAHTAWLLLHPTTRAEMFASDEARFERIVADSDWTMVAGWDLDRVVQDDPGRYIVYFDLPSGPLPDLLVAPLDKNLWLLSAPPAGAAPDALSWFYVRLDGDGEGLWPLGG